MRRQVPSPLSNLPVDGIERMLRQPACALACAAAIAGLALVFVSVRALPLLGGILATLAIGCVGPWVAVCGARVSIGWDVRRCRVGDTLRGTITCRWLLPGLRPRLAVRWPEPGNASRPALADAAMAALTADGSPDLLAVVPQRRGRFPRPAPVVESCQPFGLARARRGIAVSQEVIVWPAPASVRVPAWVAATAGSGHELSERVAGHASDPIGARDYRVGDSMRSIHWAHTARRDALIVRERLGNAAAVVRVVVDHRFQGVESGELFEALVAIAFAIVESWGSRGISLELAWPGRGPWLLRTAADRTAALDELACLEPLPVDVAAVPTRQRRRPVNLEILLTTSSGRHSLAAAVGVGGHARHQRVWVIVGGCDRSNDRGFRRGAGPEVAVHVPLRPDPVAAVDTAFASLGHDPDARARVEGARRRRSHAPS